MTLSYFIIKRLGAASTLWQLTVCYVDRQGNRRLMVGAHRLRSDAVDCVRGL